MNLLEAIFHSALAQRLAQNTQATQEGQIAGRDVGNIPVLGGILTGGGQGNGLSPLNFLNTAGMVNEGAANLAKALTGLGMAGTGAVAQSPLLPATQEHRAEGAAALAAFQQPGNPYERALAANEAGAQGHGFAVGLVNAALNPLNYVGPAGDAGTALRTAQEAGPLARALGGALEAGSLTGHAAMLPYQAGFGALGYGVKGVGRGILGALRGGAPEAAQAAAPAAATAIDNAIAPAVADRAATSNVDALRQAATFSDDPAVAKAAREQLAALEAAPAPATPVTPAALRQLADVLEANQGSGPASATDVARLGGLTDRRPLQIAPDAGRLDLATTPYAGATQLPPPLNAVTPVEEAIAKAASYGPLDRPVGLPQAAAPDLAAKIALLPEAGIAAPAVPAPALSAPPAAPTGTLDDVRRLIQGESQRVGTQYPPLNAKFYADRANVDPAQVPAMLDQLVSEGTLGRLPDGSLALKPPSAPVDRAAWQAEYVGQSQAGTDILAAGDKVGGSDLTQADLNALSPQERMAALRKLAGGDIAAGGGGFGLLPGRGGLGNPITAALASRPVLGGLAGATAGGALGLSQGDQPNGGNFWRDVAAGGALGAGGAAVGGSPITRSIGADMAAQMREAVATGEQSILPGGGKAGKDRFAASTSYLRQARKTGLFTIGRNLSDDAAKLAMGGYSVPQYVADVAHMVGQSPTALPALRGAAGDAEQIAMARYAQSPDRIRRTMDPETYRMLLKSIGTDYANDPTDLGSANVHPGYGAIRGGLLALASPKVLVTGPFTPLAGAIEGATGPARVAAQQAVLGPADIAARLIPAEDPVRRELAQAAPAMIRKIAATGQATTLLRPDGMFSSSLIKDPTLAAEWLATKQAATDKAGAVSKDILGNFATDSGARKVLNTLFPGAVWNIGQAQVLARAAARHPQAALAALNLMREDYQRHLAEGDPEHAGTYRLTDKTPGLGLLARIANGGAAGNYDVPLTYSFSPFGGETLNLPRQLDPYLNPGQSLYDKGKTVGAALGASDNPLLDMLAYRTGMASQPHVDPMRSAPIGQFADQMLAAKGALPLAANPLATALTPEGAQQDVGTALRLGRYLDPAALRAGAEIVQEQTGKPLIDRGNIDYVAQLHDPTSPLYQQALARGLGGRAATAVAGEFIPGGPQATTATQAAVDQAQMGLQRQGLPVTRAQIAMLQSDPEGARAILGAQFQARVDQAKASNPLLATYDAANPGMLATLLMGQWARDNALLGFFPGILDFQRNIEAEKLGLLPPGTLAQKQQTMDLVNQGILPGLPQVAPGVPMQISPQGADAVRALNQIRR